MIKHPLTDKGIDTFLADWEKATASAGGVPAALRADSSSG